MIKTTAMFSAHAIHLLVRNTLIFLVLLAIALFVWLCIGIRIDTIKSSGYRVDGLYIKFDKKLTLKAENIIIPKRKAKPSIDRVNETFESIKYVLKFFNHIELNNIHFNNNDLGIYYRDNIIQISSKDYLIRGDVYREGNLLKGKIPMLQLKKLNILIRGEFTYNLDEDSLVTEGKFLIKDTTGFFRASKKKEKIDFSLSSGEFTDLKFFIDQFDIDLDIKSWIVDKVKAKKYQIISLGGKGNVVDEEFKLELDSLKATALLSGVTIAFNEALDPVLARSLILNYHDASGLRFDLEHPTYLGKNLEGSTVSIVNLKDNNTTLKLNLKFHTRFDKKVQTLLHTYNIDVPVLQENGKVIASLDADIGLKKSATHFVANVKFSESNVSIKGITLAIKKGKLHYENNSITLSDIMLVHPLYEGKLNGKIDLKKYKADLIFNAKKVLLKTKSETLVKIKNKKIPFSLLYKDEVKVNIPNYTLTLKSTKKESMLIIKDLNKVKTYISDAIPIEEGGNITIKTKDFGIYTFNGIINRSTCFIYDNNNDCKVRVPFHGKVSSTDLDFYAFDKRLHYNKRKERITLKNINIDLKKFLESGEKEKDIKNTKSKKAKKTKKKNLVIIGENSHLRYGEYSLITDSFDVEIKGNGDIKAIGSADGDIIKFSKMNDVLTLKALRIKDKILHPLINFYGLQKGRYSISKQGNPEKLMKAEIIVEGGVMSGFKAYNNTLAFINTIPALVTLQNPGYSSEGFIIESAVIAYTMKNRKKIIFDSIYIKGDSATILGKGEINLEKKTINIELGIQVARTLGNVVGSIPLVGYILVGKEKSLTVGLQISGSLDKPEVSVSTAKDILSYPLEVIKRTFEAPGHFLNSENNTEEITK